MLPVVQGAVADSTLDHGLAVGAVGWWPLESLDDTVGWWPLDDAESLEQNAKRRKTNERLDFTRRDIQGLVRFREKYGSCLTNKYL